MCLSSLLSKPSPLPPLPTQPLPVKPAPVYGSSGQKLGSTKSGVKKKGTSGFQIDIQGGSADKSLVVPTGT